MAVDEALLVEAADRGDLTLRFYQWETPTLSLGYFQPYETRRAHKASENCDCVRRRSGGGALLHDNELTYSLALPTKELPNQDPAPLYRVVHQSLIAALGSLLPSTERISLRKETIANPFDEPFLCFHRLGEGDVIIDQHKIAGSAQRKSRGALLQHGGVLLGSSTSAPELPGMRELLGQSIAAEELAECWSKRIAASLGKSFLASPLPENTARAATAKTSCRFADPAWTKRR